MEKEIATLAIRPTREQWAEIQRLAQELQRTKRIELVGYLLSEIGTIHNHPHARQFWRNATVREYEL